ncbi:MAG: ATP-binding protein [Microscillaceae bacterium]|nr:ATP-binding protein [Microscillaceae bacterium]
MKLTKFDIGAEIISILTKGMYPDPRDAVREYIQNAIDAKAKNVAIKVRQNSVVVEDDGTGMDYDTLRKAIRLGVSDKRPGKDVGFMGIGIYSSFHLCDKLYIYTRKKNKLPQVLQMDFKGMRVLLDEQKEKRLSGEIKSEDLTDLQTLLQKHISLPDENVIKEEEYPVSNGTRIELEGLNPILDDVLNKFDDIANYLRDVVPLHFDKENFRWAEMIENKIEQVCIANSAQFELVNLKLQVGSRIETLYRPYRDIEFSNNIPFEPEFFEIKSNSDFLGIAWGCLNSSRERLKTKELRGFLLKKQGFSIGKRENLSSYFGRSNTFFDRYTGEIIVINTQILPTASRTDLEASELKTKLLHQIQDKVAPYYILNANSFQEKDKAKEILTEKGNALKQLLIDFNPNEDNYNVIMKLLFQCEDIISKLDNKRISKLDEEDRKIAKQVLESAEKLKREIALKFDELTSKKKKKTQKNNTNQNNNKIQIAETLTDFTAQEITTKFDGLLALIDHLGIDYNEQMKEMLSLVDSRFIQAMAETKNHYYQLLNELKDDFENI